MSNKNSKTGSESWLFAQFMVYNRYSSLGETYAEAFPGDGLAKDWRTDPRARKHAYKKGTEILRRRSVIKYMDEIREQLCLVANMTPEQHIARLRRLGEVAEASGDMKAAIHVEELMGKAMGFYVERRHITHEEILNPVQIQERLAQLIAENPNLLPMLEARVVNEEENILNTIDLV